MAAERIRAGMAQIILAGGAETMSMPVSYTHLRAHETVLDIVCRLLLEKKKVSQQKISV